MYDIKWGKSFNEQETAILNEKYDSICKSFNLHTYVHYDCLVVWCIASLRLQQALIKNNSTEAEKWERIYESLMKLGRFAPSQQRGEG